MIRLPLDPSIGIERFDPTRSDEEVRVVAQQVTHFMDVVVQRGVYEEDLGLTYIDEDPRPDPEDEDHLLWRMGRLRNSGLVEHTGLEFIRAVRLDDEARPMTDLAANLGLLVLRKPKGKLCVPGLHRPTEVLEFDVVEDLRGQGVGRAMLREGMRGVHAEDRVVLDVARPNTAAQETYGHYGFRYSRGKPKRHGTFDVEHIGMYTNAADFQARLGLRTS